MKAHSRSFVQVALLLVLLVLAIAPVTRAQTDPLLPIPAALPQHFALGLSAHPNDSGLYGWMPDSEIPWDYAYQYLAGGVNTGNGWRTWNTDAQFPLLYARGAAEQDAIPVFPYYMLYQSNGPCLGCGEAEHDLALLNDPQTMAAYYEDFALLMKRLGPGLHDGIAGYGDVAIVHVEPDLSGYAMHAVLDNSHCYGHCGGQGNDPALLGAAVSSSGVADVAGYADTYQGFNWALLHLRDLYAPNVLLAFHVSTWAPVYDVGTSTDPTLDANALGEAAGAFAALSGVSTAPQGTSTYDLLFNDVADRDAGYYQYVRGDPSRWWDRLNVTYPNFQRWEQYLGAAVRVAGRPALVWQIPLGNQRYASMNNSDGHYQDNRAEYFLEHVDELAASGVIGLLFGRGNAGSTTLYDDRLDGVTNPPAFCTTDGVSSGQMCNETISDHPDDDGGYLRLTARQYYLAGPLLLEGGVALPPAPTPSSIPGGDVTPVESLSIALGASACDPTFAPPGQDVYVLQSFTASRDAVVLVDFELYDAQGTQVWQAWHASYEVFAAETATSSASFRVPNDLAAGDYTFKVGVFSTDWTTLYAWNDNAGVLTVP